MKSILIKMLVKSIGQSDLFNEIKELVEAIASTDISGKEKRALVLEELSDVASVASGLILNVLIELAVLYIKK